MPHFEQFESLLRIGRSHANRLSIVWFASIWNISKARNDKVVNNKEISFEQVLEVVHKEFVELVKKQNGL